MENHEVNIENREKITITKVTDVDSFNEETILVVLSSGGMMIKGHSLHIQKLDLDEGKVIIAGTVDSVVYTEKKNKGEKGFLKALLK
ncbi:MAG: sporulation protein YabP [Anaerovorax sp.]